MSEEGLVSIIIPYYKKKETIRRSVQSVIDQSYNNWELYIIDDCSPEELPVEPGWSAYPIEILKNEVNLGAGPTRQRGLELSKGEYICFLDADDWWDENFLSICIEKLKTDKSNMYAGAYVKSIVINSDGTKKIRRNSEFGLERIRETVVQYARPWQTGSIVWKRKCCGTWGKLKTQEDSWFELKSSKQANQLKLVTGSYYYHDETGSNHLSFFYNSSENAINQLELFLMFQDELKQLISLRYRVVLFHRLVRCLLKVSEYAPVEKKSYYWSRVKQSSFLFRFFMESQLVLKVIHKLLQRTPFKIYY